MKKYFQSVFVRYTVFGLCLFAVAIGLSMIESNFKVRTSFDETSVTIKSTKYSLNVPYDMVASLELTEMPDPGEAVDGIDDQTVRTGVWKNETWGEYRVCADPDSTNCVVIRLTDGRIFVFSLKNNEATEESYEAFLSRLPQ